MLTLRQTRISLEKFVYEKGTNVALYNAEHSKEYQDFKDKLESFLYQQILQVASTNRVNTLLLFTKADIPDDLVDEVGLALGGMLASKQIDMKTYLVWAGAQGGQAFLDKVGIQGVFGLRNPDLVDYFGNHSNLILNSVDDYTKQWVAEKIQQGKDKVLSPQEIVQSLIDEGKNITKLRAERITLTETANAMTRVELAASIRYGLTLKLWRTSVDDRVCPICLPLDDGIPVPIEEDFEGGFYGPPAHVSCRCFIEHVLPEDWSVPDKLWLGD
jgi:hypothetical protein